MLTKVLKLFVLLFHFIIKLWNDFLKGLYCVKINKSGDNDFTPKD